MTGAIGPTRGGKTHLMRQALADWAAAHPLGQVRSWGGGLIVLEPGPEVIPGEVISRARELERDTPKENPQVHPGGLASRPATLIACEANDSQHSRPAGQAPVIYAPGVSRPPEPAMPEQPACRSPRPGGRPSEGADRTVPKGSAAPAGERRALPRGQRAESGPRKPPGSRSPA